MNKLFSKIAGLSVGLAMAVGVGVTVGQSVKEVKAAEYVELDCDFTKKTTGNAKYNSNDLWDYDDNFAVWNGANNNKGWDYVKMGGKSEYIATYNPVYIVTKVASTHAISKVTVNILPNTNSNKTKMSATWKLYVASDSGFSSVTDTVDKGALDITTAGLYTFEPTSGNTWAIGSYFKVEWTCTNTSTTNGIVWLNHVTTYYEESAIVPDEVIISGASAVSVGEQIELSAEARKSGSATGVDQNVVWSSLNGGIASVSSTGVVTGFNNGTATIRATAKEDSNVYGEIVVTVSNGKSDNSAVALLPADFPTSYGDSYITVSGVYFHAKQMMINDGVIQIQKNNGLFENVAPFAQDIKRIELTLNAGKQQGTGAELFVSADGSSFTSLGEVSSENYAFDVAAGNRFVKLVGTTQYTLYLDEILVGFGNANEAKMVTLANSLNTLLDSECQGASDTSPITSEKWAEIAQAYADGDADAKAALAAVGASGSYQEVNKFLSRYDHIVAAYGYTNFLAREVPSSAYNMPIENSGSTIIIIIAATFALTTFGAVLLIRKKKHNK